mgnify:CR=1 FL=1
MPVVPSAAALVFVQPAHAPASIRLTPDAGGEPRLLPLPARPTPE